MSGTECLQAFLFLCLCAALPVLHQRFDRLNRDEDLQTAHTIGEVKE